MMAVEHTNTPAVFHHVWYYLFFSLFGLSGILSGVFGFYLFYSFLFPKLLRRKKILAFFILGVAGAGACAIASSLVLSFLFGAKVMFADGWSSATGIMVILSILSLINGVIGLVMRGFITWYGDIKLKEELNKKNYEMELALVKSQINPHFLFNTINNIDVLIEMDAVKASAYLNKLSDIMRFMLYETKTEQIPLAKELAYIEKYIELQKLRTANTNYIQYSVEGETGNIMIEPMLFIPFIENAFKHAENKKIDNAISIRFAIDKGKIIFECGNNYSITQIKPEYGGLGNELIKKRLALLYPGKHTLEITGIDKTYSVKLVLTNE